MNERPTATCECHRIVGPGGDKPEQWICECGLQWVVGGLGADGAKLQPRPNLQAESEGKMDD